MKFKTLVAASLLAFSAGKRILFMGLRMQKYRKVAADRLEAQRYHRLGGRPHDNVIPVRDRQTQQLVANGSADPIDFHRWRRR